MSKKRYRVSAPGTDDLVVTVKEVVAVGDRGELFKVYVARNDVTGVMSGSSSERGAYNAVLKKDLSTDLSRSSR